MRMKRRFPRQDLLYPGALLGSIAHAVFVAKYPDLAHTQSWDGENYCVQDSSGSRGTVTFSTMGFVGVFFSEDSNRNPFRGGSEVSIDSLFSGIPSDLRELAEHEALQFVLQELDDTTRPVATSVFWAAKESANLASSEPWNVVHSHGAFLLEKQLLPLERALGAWADEFEFTKQETRLIQDIFIRRNSDATRPVRITASEREMIFARSSDRDGVDACRESFSEIQVII